MQSPNQNLREDNVTKLTGESLQLVAKNAKASVERSTSALLAHNREAIEKEFSAAFTASGGDWRFANREDMIKRISGGHVKYDYIKTDVESVEAPSEHVAIVSGTRSVKAVVDGKDFASTFPFKAVHALEGGQWRVVMWAVNC